MPGIFGPVLCCSALALTPTQMTVISGMAAQVAPVSAASGFVPGARTLFATDFTQEALGEFPKQLRSVSGSLEIVERGGARMLMASGPAEFRVDLPQVLPEDFTLEFDLIPKLRSGSADLGFEGTAVLNQTSSSAEIFWQPELQHVVGGGTSPYLSSTVADAALAGQLVHIALSFEGDQLKLFVNGQRRYTLSDRRFTRSRVLRVFLGGQDFGDQAVYLARLRIGIGGAMIANAAVAASDPRLVVGAPPGSGAAAVTTTSVSAVPAVATGTSTPMSPSPPPPPPPPPPQPAPAAPATPPIGGTELPPPDEQQAAGTPITMRLTDEGVFNVMLVRGGSVAGQVVETRLSTGEIKKNLSGLVYEPIVVDVAPGTAMNFWIRDHLSGLYARRNGSLFGGIIEAGQELDFSNAMMTSVIVPTLDAASSAAGYLRLTLVPEYTNQVALSGSTASTPRSWTVKDFKFLMGNLETTRVTRIESFAATTSITETTVGATRDYTTTPTGKPEVSNLLVTFEVDATDPATNWLAWYDDFVVKGNNTDANEKSFTLILGPGQSAPIGDKRSYTDPAAMKLQGYGVGIVALRALPQPFGSTVRLLQAELYVERMEVVP